MDAADPPADLIPSEDARRVAPNFVTDAIDDDLRAGRVREVVTRFPPEPNGYLHVGHVKAIFIDFAVAADYGGRTFLRFDDTNPTTEDTEFVEAMKRDIAWLGFEWSEERHASDYFERLYELARVLIRRGHAYVDSQTEEEIRDGRGTVTEPGTASPYRERSVEANLDLFARMRAGEFPDGAHVLRAKIDMSSPNMLMRDPLLYRIRHHAHYRTGSAWPIYPMYDFAHPLSDAIEGITHSLCTLEFDNNREVYDWLLERLIEAGEFTRPRPHQYEFARLNPEYTVTSKRKLIPLVREGAVDGWDDPRMPTISGLRRRGVPPEALCTFANRVGYTKANARTDIALLEHTIRDELNTRAPRVMGVLDPLRVTLTNVDEDHLETLDAPHWPHDVPGDSTRPLPFGRDVAIERGDFADDPPKGWRRLSPGATVRLRHAVVITCDEVVRDAAGQPIELRCRVRDEADLEAEGSKVRGVLHWVHAPSALEAEIRLYDRLFADPEPDATEGDLVDKVNPGSLRVVRGLVEPSVADDPVDTRYQFERSGYFWRDPVDGRGDALVFNRIVTLKDGWTRRHADDRPAAGDSEEEPEASRRPAARAGEEPEPIDMLPAEQLPVFERYRGDLGLSETDAARIAADPAVADLFDAALQRHDNADGLANWVVNEVLRELKGSPGGAMPLGPSDLAELVALVDEGVLNNRIAKEVFDAVLAGEGSPRAIVADRGLEQVTDEEAIRRAVDEVLAAHPDEVATYREGKTGLIGFFIGQVMRATGGKANPHTVREAVAAALDGSSD